MEIIAEPALILHLLARIGTVLAQPVTLVHPSHFEMLGGPRIREIAARAEFTPWLNDAVAKSLGMRSFELPEGLADRLARHPQSRAAALVAGAQPQEIALAARLVAAAIQRRRLSALVTRAERSAAVAQLGSGAFQLAVREAFALYPGLAELAPEETVPLEMEAEGIDDVPPLTVPGYACLGAFLSQVEPGLRPLLTYRVPQDLTLPETVLAPGPHGQLLALLRRKIPGWHECIG